MPGKLLFILISTLILGYSGSGFSTYVPNNTGNTLLGKSSGFSSLARHVTQQSDIALRDFAVITTSTMIDAYSRALQKSSRIRPRSQAESRKQRTWGWATSRVIASLKRHLRKLENGSAFSLYIDHLGQVLIIVDGQEFLASSPYADGQAGFEQQVVDYYCSYNDCGWLQQASKEPQEPPQPRTIVDLRSRLSRGNWVFSQHDGPAYDIGDMIRCEYRDSMNRTEKAEFCHQIANNILQIIISLTEIDDTNLKINWSVLLKSQPDPGSTQFSLLPDNDQFTVHSELLSSLSTADWVRLIKWLEYYEPDSKTPLSFKHIELM